MRLAIVTIFALGLASCSPAFSSNKLQTICIDGVTYIFYKAGYSSVLSVKLNKDSKVELCE